MALFFRDICCFWLGVARAVGSVMKFGEYVLNQVLFVAEGGFLDGDEDLILGEVLSGAEFDEVFGGDDEGDFFVCVIEEGTCGEGVVVGAEDLGGDLDSGA